MTRARRQAAAAATAVILLVAWWTTAAYAVGPGRVCGGIGAIPCDAGLWCNPLANQCKVADGSGRCARVPTACTKQYRPVCGCDGRTYGNDCERLMAKIGLQHSGACRGAPPPPQQGGKPVGLGGVCGGYTNAQCKANLWCNNPPGQCGASAGTCARVPLFCLKRSKPVCGCDNQTYASDCLRRKAKVSLNYAGACR